MIDRNTEPYFGVERRIYKADYTTRTSPPGPICKDPIGHVTLIQSNKNSNKFHNKKNRPFLTRLVGDPIGKEAGRETNIGDKNNVNKCIN